MSKKVIVVNLNSATTEETLQNTFSQYGEISSVSIHAAPENNQNMGGMGMIEFANDADAESAVSAMNGAELDGNQIKVEIANGKMEPPQGGFGGGQGGGRPQGGPGGQGGFGGNQGGFGGGQGGGRPQGGPGGQGGFGGGQGGRGR